MKSKMVINMKKGDSITNPIKAAKKSAKGLTTLVYILFFSKIAKKLSPISYTRLKSLAKQPFVHILTLSFLWHLTLVF